MLGGLGVGVALLSAVALAGCSSDTSDTSGESSNTAASDVAAAASSIAVTASSIAAAASSAAENGGIASAAGDEAIRTGAVAVTGAASGEWQGSTLRLTFSSGSKSDVASNAFCQALELLLGQGDTAVLAYPDGDLTCPAAG